MRKEATIDDIVYYMAEKSLRAQEEARAQARAKFKASQKR